jgi:hypothetical protein
MEAIAGSRWTESYIRNEKAATQRSAEVEAEAEWADEAMVGIMWVAPNCRSQRLGWRGRQDADGVWKEVIEYYYGMTGGGLAES